jgi:hypothetical protein
VPFTTTPEGAKGMDGLTEGRIVHYVPEAHRGMNHCQGAIVVKNWGGGTVNLTVLGDWGNDGMASGSEWATSRAFDASGAPGTYHDPRSCPRA